MDFSLPDGRQAPHSVGGPVLDFWRTQLADDIGRGENPQDPAEGTTVYDGLNTAAMFFPFF